MKKIIIDREKCKGCGLCVFYCQKKLITIDVSLNKKGIPPAVFFDKENNCRGCAFCALICPDTAITVEK